MILGADYIFPVIVLPLVAGLAVCVAFRRRESLFGWLGLGHAGSQTAIPLRSLTGIDRIRFLGPAEPFMWILFGTLIVAGLWMLFGLVVRRLRTTH